MDRTGKMDMARGDGKYKDKQGHLHDAQDVALSARPYLSSLQPQTWGAVSHPIAIGPQIIYA